jgi:TRAP-type C4-dicarboxylate transport system permease small subunit
MIEMYANIVMESVSILLKFIKYAIYIMFFAYMIWFSFIYRFEHTKLTETELLSDFISIPINKLKAK